MDKLKIILINFTKTSRVSIILFSKTAGDTSIFIILFLYFFIMIFFLKVGLKFSFGGGVKTDNSGRVVWCERSTSNSGLTKHDQTIKIEELPVINDIIFDLNENAARR